MWNIYRKPWGSREGKWSVTNAENLLEGKEKEAVKSQKETAET